MGGAIAVHVASQEFIPSLIGLCVIDVVEGLSSFNLSFYFGERINNALFSVLFSFGWLTGWSRGQLHSPMVGYRRCQR